MEKTEKTRRIAAMKAGMDEKTARKYLAAGEFPTKLQAVHNWRTRKDGLEALWPEAREILRENPGLEAKYLFESFQRKHSGKYEDSLLRTFQRRVKHWRALEGPEKEIFFDQVHKPGEICASDFTSMNALGITILNQPFDHLIYHFVLTYSNWETGSIAFSESFEAFSQGFQNALSELGGVPKKHRTDCLSACIRPIGSTETFTDRYRALLNYYGLEAQKTNPGQGHENGDVEQSHYRFKRPLDQALMLRGSRDFSSRKEYEEFLQNFFRQKNSGRKIRLAEESAVLRRLPVRRLEDSASIPVKVTQASTIHIHRNIYSVPSRLIGEWVHVKVYGERLELWYSDRKVEEIPRIQGRNRHWIQYRHMIDWLVRKPGAFEHYRYQADFFPTSYFRMAYDELTERLTQPKASREYLAILALAAKEGEEKVNEVLKYSLSNSKPIYLETVEKLLEGDEKIRLPEIAVAAVKLEDYDGLLDMIEEVA